MQVVPAGFHFLWPPVSVGHRRTVAGGVELETLSLQPAVFRVRNLVSAAETEELIAQAEAGNVTHKLERSMVGDDPVAGRTKSDMRTSHHAWDEGGAVAEALKHRAFALLNLGDYRDDQIDGLQILRYQPGQAYIQHHDWFPPQPPPNAAELTPRMGGSNRIATLFVYLSDVAHGGQTVWTQTDNVSEYGADARARAAALFPAGGWEAELVEECHTKLSVAPVRGEAVHLKRETLPPSLCSPLQPYATLPLS